MAQSPYYHLIQRYFPQEQWEIADCILTHECPPDSLGYPGCVRDEGLIDCGYGPAEAKSWGLFRILDACWNPEMHPESPFTTEQWAQVPNPNVNTWMASVIWERAGWRAWTTCDLCDACDIVGGPIPYPRGPVEEPVARSVPLLSLVGVLAAFVGLAVLDSRRRQ